MGWGQAIGASIDAAKAERQNKVGNESAAAQINASRDAMQFDLAQYNQNRADNLNALVTGNSAVNALARLYGLDMYSGQVNTNPITMSGGGASANGSAKWYDPGGFFGGSKLSTTPVQFQTGNVGGGGITSGTNRLVGSGGSTGGGAGQMDFSSFFESPDYLFALQQGIQGQDRSAAARGGLYSGGHQADLVNYNQGMASQQLGNYTNNLMRIAGFGGQASGQIGNFGNSTASRVGNNLANAGNARASSYFNSGQATNDMYSNWGNRFSDWYGQRQGNQNMLVGSGGSTGGTDYGAFSPNNGSSYNFNQSGWW